MRNNEDVCHSISNATAAEMIHSIRSLRSGVVSSRLFIKGGVRGLLRDSPSTLWLAPATIPSSLQRHNLHNSGRCDSSCFISTYTETRGTPLNATVIDQGLVHINFLRMSRCRRSNDAARRISL